MTEKSHKLFAAISLCAVLCYCVFLIKNAASDVDTTEETLPYSLAIVNEELQTELPGDTSVSLNVTSVAKEPVEIESHAIESHTEISREEASEAQKDGFSPIYPVKGEIITAYSMRHTYNPSSGDWRAHGGIDIKSTENDSVFAVEDGAVSQVYTTPSWGTVIKIDHGEYVSIYKNLVDSLVEEGDSVTRGDIVAHVGKSAPLEASLPEHLHFEMTHYGESVNPSDFLD